MKNAVKKAVILVAGRGSRIRPLTYAYPKGLVGVFDKPAIHYLIDELKEVGIQDIIIVISRNQTQFQKYIQKVKPESAWRTLNFRFTTQKKLRGSADALLTAQKFIKEEPFIVFFCDDLLHSSVSPTKTSIKIFESKKGFILTLYEVPKHLIQRWGIVSVKKMGKDLYKIKDIVEKPKPEEAPSSIGSIGRFILTPRIFPFIKETEKIFKNKKEVAIADALKLYLQKGGDVYGWKFRGQHFDTGSKTGLLKAQIYFGLQNNEFKKEIRKYLKLI